MCVIMVPFGIHTLVDSWCPCVNVVPFADSKGGSLVLCSINIFVSSKCITLVIYVHPLAGSNCGTLVIYTLWLLVSVAHSYGIDPHLIVSVVSSCYIPPF